MPSCQLFRVVTAAVIYKDGKFLLGRRHPKDDNPPPNVLRVLEKANQPKYRELGALFDKIHDKLTKKR